MRTHITLEIRDAHGFVLRRIVIATDSPIPASIRVAAAIKKEFGDKVVESR
jgi:hypothetical protein